MRRYRFVNQKVMVVDIIECNCCGERMPSFSVNSDEKVKEGIHVDYTWGYFSKKDMTRHTADICEDCWDKITSAFKIPVEVPEAGDPEEDKAPDDHSVAEAVLPTTEAGNALVDELMRQARRGLLQSDH